MSRPALNRKTGFWLIIERRQKISLIFGKSKKKGTDQLPCLCICYFHSLDGKNSLVFSLREHLHIHEIFIVDQNKSHFLHNYQKFSIKLYVVAIY